VRELLTQPQVEEFCSGHSRWTTDGVTLHGSATAGSFVKAIAWVNEIAVIAESLDHHPDIDIRWHTLNFSLSTHSAGGITELDTALAAGIDDLVREPAN
jgi:4a-hydroxytetrahydrobiopterin dehydratase